MSPVISWLLLFAANFMWAFQYTCIKLVQDQVGSLFTVWGPMTLATLMLYPLVRNVQRQPGYVDRRRKSDIWLFLTLAAVGVFPGQVLVTWGTRLSTASNAALIMLTLPLSTAVLAVILLGERMTRLRWASAAPVIIRVILLGQGGSTKLTFGTGDLTGFIRATPATTTIRDLILSWIATTMATSTATTSANSPPASTTPATHPGRWAAPQPTPQPSMSMATAMSTASTSVCLRRATTSLAIRRDAGCRIIVQPVILRA